LHLKLILKAAAYLLGGWDDLKERADSRSSWFADQHCSVHGGYMIFQAKIEEMSETMVLSCHIW